MNWLIDHVPLTHSPYVVGLAGSVAAGKSTLAGQLATAWRGQGKRVEVVSTDGFLYPNAVLESRSLLNRKGFPESYDVASFSAFLDAVRVGKPSRVPVYSHQTYDILQQRRQIQPVDVMMVEGINALQPAFTAGKLDYAIYLDASEVDLFHWYHERAMLLRESARTDSTSYFVRYLELSDAAWESQVRAFWDDINLPNLHQHIAPSKAEADMLLLKARDHTIIKTQ